MAGLEDKSKLHPKLNYTPDERSLFGQLFRDCDPEGTGIVTGDAAVKLFQRTRLPEQVLGEIWGLADVENRGFLTQEDFAKALRLIAQYQAQPGIKLNLDLALTPAPLPKFDGINMQTPQVTGYTAPIQAQNSGPIRVPPLPPDRVVEYARLFDRAGAQNGLLQGEVARTSFEKSGLPADVLAHVWNLADTEQRGALSITEFIIAMHLLASYKAKTLAALPQSIPAGLYEAASRRPPVQPAGRPQSARAADLGAIPRQSSGSGLIRGASGRQFSPPASSDWAIGDREKAQYDALFDKVDQQKIGMISGDQAVGFFGDSGLPSEILAQVWDLSNIRRQDSLNRDEFAVAMHLIRSQRGKQIFDLPSELPPNLIPPSIRALANPALVSSQFSMQQPAPAPIKSNTDDLFGLDALTASPIVSVPRDTTGGSGPLSDPFAAKTESPRAAGSFTSSPAQQTFFRSFAPTSSFGQSIVAQSTGASAGSGSVIKQSSAMDDLLGDTDPEISKKLTKDTSDLANMSNEISTLRTQMQEVQNKKAVTEADLNNSAQQKRDMEQRLELFRAQFEQTRQALAAAEEKLGVERGEVAKLGQQIALIDAQAQDVRVKHADIQAQLQAVQRERDGLKEKMRQLNEYVAQTQPEIERMQADLRQQKGLLAITKKQVEKVEDEKTQLDKTKAELTDQQQQIKSQSQSPEVSTRQPVAREVTASSAVSSPSIASASMNPFMRRTPQQSIDNTVSSSASVTSNKFDNIFSTAFVTPSATTVPPTTSFRQDATAFAQSVPQSQPSQSQSGPSIRSSEPGDVPTPSTSPPLSSAYQDSPQLPPPPTSRQITSKDLPLAGGEQTQRSRGADGESVATSVRVETPLSRYDVGSTPTAPSTGLERPETAKSTGHASVGSKGDIEAAFASVGKTTSRQNTGSGFEDLNVSGPVASNSNDPLAKFNSEFPEIKMTTSGKSATPAKKEDEFPPIKNLEADDDSDSEAAGGFDDDFTKASPPPVAPIAPTAPVTSSSPTQAKSAPRGLGEDIFGQQTGASTHSQGEALFGAAKPTTSTFSPISSTLSPTTLSSLPPLPASESASVGTARGDTASPDQQLRERASNVPSETTFASAVSVQSGSPGAVGAGVGLANADTILSGTGEHLASEQSGPAVLPKGKSPFDGFDTSMFDKLAPAREADADTRLDDDLLLFGGNQQQRGGHADDEFSATFDAPPQPPPKIVQGKFGDDAFGIGFSEFDNSFANSLGASTSSTAPKATTGSTHDWDAIMKGFDEQPKETTTNKKFSFEPEDEFFSGPPPEAPEPPKLGRMMSEGTEHDDPILKRLMGVGYPRPMALAALEKFDYDIEKASDYLASPK